MAIKKAQFIKSAVHPKDYPQAGPPEIAFTGRSNAGKSSLINAWTGQKQMAMVSNTPGKTRLLNFFDINNSSYRIVDMPGYGFAARGVDEMKDYRKMVESYFSLRAEVCCLILVMDSRRDITPDEELLIQFANQIEKPIAIVATKVDKLNQKELNQRKKAILSQVKNLNVKDVSKIQVYFVSSTQREGVVELEENVYRHYIQNFSL